VDSSAPSTSQSPVASEGPVVVHPPASAEPTPARQSPLPGWGSVGESLAGQDGSTAVLERCQVVGRNLAEAGASVREGLEGLRSTTLLVLGREPTFEEALAVSDGWAEATLSWMNRLTCADAETGLATRAHLLQLLADSYRSSPGEHARLLLVVVELPPEEVLVSQTRRLNLVGGSVGSAFYDALAVARIGARRVVALVTRSPNVSPRTALLDRMLEDLRAQVWVEPLPSTHESAVWLVDELAR
jgi:hypothetical protein